MEENASKVFDAPDALASAAVLNASGPSAGNSLFVINLCASMAPIANVGKSLPGLESYRLYQVSRREDGRTRHRLRLGFFATEVAAENVLNSVRAAYPTAFTTCLCDEDRRFARNFVPEPSVEPGAPAIPQIADSLDSTAQHRAPKPSATPAATQATRAAPPAAQPSKLLDEALAAEALAAKSKAPAPVTKPAPSATKLEAATALDSTAKHATLKLAANAAATVEPAAASAELSGRKDVIEKPSNLLAAIELTLESEPAAPTAPAASAASSSEPFRVSKGADIPAVSLTLDTEPAKPHAPAPPAARSAPAAKPAAAPAAKAPPAPAKPVEAAKPKPAAAPAPPATPVSALAKQLSSLPDLDSTQTIRALTSDELSDESQEKWYAIQLAVSDQPVNLETMPRLDIFEAYRLYSVANAGSGKITHCLRIGFFREDVSAEAVCGYLKTFFHSPTVVRISIAEQARFKDPPDRSPSAAGAGAQERPPDRSPSAARAGAQERPSSKTDARVLDLSHARERTVKPIPTVTMAVDTPRFDANATGTFKATATGSHRALATGTHKALATGSHQALNATGKHKALSATGAHKALKTSKSTTSATGKHKTLQAKKSLSEQLLDEAREVELSESGIRKLPKNNSLLSKMFGKRK